MAKLTYFPNC